MPVEIQEMVSKVTVVDPKALLSPEVLGKVVDAVISELNARKQAAGSRSTELDLRPIVQQQRTKGAS